MVFGKTLPAYLYMGKDTQKEKTVRFLKGFAHIYPSRFQTIFHGLSGKNIERTLNRNNEKNPVHDQILLILWFVLHLNTLTQTVMEISSSEYIDK